MKRRLQFTKLIERASWEQVVAVGNKTPEEVQDGKQTRGFVWLARRARLTGWFWKREELADREEEQGAAEHRDSRQAFWQHREQA